MRKRFMAAATWVLAVTALGCGGSSDTTHGNGLNVSSYICTFPATQGICLEWTTNRALTPEEVQQLQGECKFFRPGTFSSGGSCPLTGNIGTCTPVGPQVAGTSLRYLFYSPPWNLASAQNACASLGNWN